MTKRKTITTKLTMESKINNTKDLLKPHQHINNRKLYKNQVKNNGPSLTDFGILHIKL